MEYTAEELALLEDIRSHKRYPIARFELASSTDDSILSIALNNVRMTDPEESMETVKARAAVLTSLQEKGAVNLCFDLPVAGRKDFAAYYESGIFAMLRELAGEGSRREGFLFDTARLRRGLAFLTESGRAALEQNQSCK